MKTIVIVDPFLSGKIVAIEANKRGYNCIGIQSSTKLPSFMTRTLVIENFSEYIVFESDIELFNRLSKYDISFAMPGSETGIELTDRINSILGLRGNDPKTSHLRRNKYFMHQKLQEIGLPIIKQTMVNNFKSALTFINSNDIQYPVVLKPLNSAGSDGFNLCHNELNLEEKFNELIRSKNIFNIENSNILIQEFIQHDEYVVNSVSLNGVHHLTDVWKYKKEYSKTGKVLYDYQILVDQHTDSQILEIVKYAHSALSQLRIQNGPSHAEVFLTPNGPRLVEVGARLQGGINPRVLNEALGYNQLDATLDIFVENLSVFDILPSSYNLKTNVMWIDMIAREKAKILKASSFVEAVENIPISKYISIHFNDNEVVEKTNDLSSSPGELYLIHEDMSVILNYYKMYKEIEEVVFKE